MDKIILKPEKVRCTGNVLGENKEVSDYILYNTILYEDISEINGEPLQTFNSEMNYAGLNFYYKNKELIVTAETDEHCSAFNYTDKALTFSSDLYKFGFSGKRLLIFDDWADYCTHDNTRNYQDYWTYQELEKLAYLYFDIDHYVIKPNRAVDTFAGVQVPFAAGFDNIRLRMKVKLDMINSDSSEQIGFVVSNSMHTAFDEPFVYFRVTGNNKIQIVDSEDDVIDISTSITTINRFLYLELTRRGDTYTFKTFDEDMTQLTSTDYIATSITNSIFSIAIDCNNINEFKKIYEIIWEMI